MARTHVSAKRILHCLRETQGLLALAARRVPCSLKYLENYLSKHPELREAVREIREESLDYAEFALRQRILAGEMNAIRFYLESQGKHRGYAREAMSAPTLIAQANAQAQYIQVDARQLITQLIASPEAVEHAQRLAQEASSLHHQPTLDSCLVGGDPGLPGDDSLPTPHPSLDLGSPPPPSGSSGHSLHSPKPNGNGQVPHPGN